MKNNACHTIRRHLPLAPLAICLLIAASCAPAPLDPAALPPHLAARLTPAKALTQPKQSLIIGKWDSGESSMELMRGGHFRIRMTNGSYIDSTGRPPQGVSGAQRGQVLPAAARWTFIESPQGDRLRFILVVDNPSGYANPNLGSGGATFFGPRSRSFEFQILFVNDDCMIIRAAGSLGVGRRAR